MYKQIAEYIGKGGHIPSDTGACAECLEWRITTHEYKNELWYDETRQTWLMECRIDTSSEYYEFNNSPTRIDLRIDNCTRLRGKVWDRRTERVEYYPNGNKIAVLRLIGNGPLLIIKSVQ